jgi:N-acetyltransferase
MLPMSSAPPSLRPHLEGALTTLRPMRSEDWDELYAAAADPEIWALHPAPTRYREEEFRSYFQSGLDGGGALVIRDRATGAVIGSSRYHGHDPALGVIEIGWTFLARSYWGGAYNREIKRLMIGHAFSFVDAVIFWVGAENRRSRRAMEKIGGELRPGAVDRPVGGLHVSYAIRNRPGWDTPLK